MTVDILNCLGLGSGYPEMQVDILSYLGFEYFEDDDGYLELFRVSIF